MDSKELISLILNVLKDFRVIVTVIAMLLIVEFAKFITNYKKKPPKPKIKKVAPPKEAKPAAGGEEKKAEGDGEKAPDAAEGEK